MKQFGTIFNFELKSYFSNKVFVGITIFLVVIIAILMFFPRFVDVIPEEEEPTENLPIMLVAGDIPSSVMESISDTFSNYNVVFSDESVESMSKKVANDEAECGFVFSGYSICSYIVNNISMYDNNIALASELISESFRFDKLSESGLTKEESLNILTYEPEIETVSSGKNQRDNFFYTYIMIFALYIVILMYGQMVTMSVATEKSSRAMELLITSAKPVSMMFGKVIAACIAGLVQLVAIFGAALLFFNINKSYWADNEIINSIFDMPFDLFVYMLIFFILGFLIYAFLYGAMGSTVSKLEDVNTQVMPVQIMFIIMFFVVMFSLGSGNSDNLLMKICSFIPLTSPMAMFTRIAMTSVPLYEIIISIVILILTAFAIGVLSARIYRAGVLMYGNPPKFSTVIKNVFKGK